MKILIFANDYHLVSGGDVIFAEMAKKWIQWGHEVEIVTNEKGADYCLSKGITINNLSTWPSSSPDNFGSFIAEPIKSILSAFRESHTQRSDVDVIFASSFFWPDLFAGIIAKRKVPRAKLVVGAYLLFPKPLSRKRYSGGFWRASALYLSQILSLKLISRFVDIVLTASEHDRPHFFNYKQLSASSVVAIRGGVEIDNIDRVRKQKKIYDALYFGRFHSQKGLFDLLDVWEKVLSSRPGSKLLLAGGGPLEDSLREKATRMGIVSSITFSGIVSGKAKYKLLKSAKLFVSASRFDTGNIALDEVLACGVPGIVYDLPHLNYLDGVVKIPVGHKIQMENEIIRLLRNQKERLRLGRAGRKFIKTFDWKIGAEKVLKLIQTT